MMQISPLLLFGGILSCIAVAASIPVLNFSVEVNHAVDRTSVFDPSVIGWNGAGLAQVIDGPANVTLDATRNAVVADSGTRKCGVDTGHILAAGDPFRASFVWRDAENWGDASDTVAVAIYTTADDTIGGAGTVLQPHTPFTAPANPPPVCGTRPV